MSLPFVFALMSESSQPCSRTLPPLPSCCLQIPSHPHPPSSKLTHKYGKNQHQFHFWILSDPPSPGDLRIEAPRSWLNGAPVALPAPPAPAPEPFRFDALAQQLQRLQEGEVHGIHRIFFQWELGRIPSSLDCLWKITHTNAHIRRNARPKGTHPSRLPAIY